MQIGAPILMWAPTADHRQIVKAGLRLPEECAVRFPPDLIRDSAVAGRAYAFTWSQGGVGALMDLNELALSWLRDPDLKIYPAVELDYITGKAEPGFFDQVYGSDGLFIITSCELRAVTLTLNPCWPDLPSLSEIVQAHDVR